MEHRPEAKPDFIDVLSVTFEDESDCWNKLISRFFKICRYSFYFLKDNDFPIVIELWSFRLQLQISLWPIFFQIWIAWKLHLAFSILLICLEIDNIWLHIFKRFEEFEGLRFRLFLSLWTFIFSHCQGTSHRSI